MAEPTSSAASTVLDSDARHREIQRVTWVGLWVNVVAAVVKLVAGVVGQSQALVADGVHSLSDIASDFLVLFAAKHAAKDADEKHPYGHARFETIATLGLGLALILIAVGISWDALDRLFNPESLLSPGWLALTVAAVAIVAKEWVYQYTMRAARRLKSKILAANAWHSRTDAIGAVVVVIGVGGSMLGLEYLDAIGAIGVAVIIAKVGWDLVWQNLHELADAGLDQERVEEIRTIIGQISGVEAVHMLRSRRLAGNALVDVHIQVAPRISVSEGHQISEAVRARVVAAVDEVIDVLVHIDPEDDEFSAACRALPLRDELERRLHDAWRNIAPAQQIKNITLHYLDGEVHVELILPLDLVRDTPDVALLQQQLIAALDSEIKIADVRLLFV